MMASSNKQCPPCTDKIDETKDKCPPANNQVPGKTSWPEVVGMKGEVAAALIKKENPHVFTVIMEPGMAPSKDYIPNRVRIFVNDRSIVTEVPFAG